MGRGTNRQWFKLMGGALLGGMVLVTLTACQGMDSNKNHPTPTMGNTDTPKDGELTLPSDYKTWPKFLVDIDKEPIKQVRDIYINGVGSRTMPGQSFSNGTVMIMEIHKAKLQADGSVEKTPEGRLIKDGLAKVFIMGKGEGWGQAVPDNFKNGAWIYGAAGSDGKPISEDFTKCRACHAPLAQKDFVYRYDEYFEKRGGI